MSSLVSISINLKGILLDLTEFKKTYQQHSDNLLGLFLHISGEYDSEIEQVRMTE